MKHWACNKPAARKRARLFLHTRPVPLLPTAAVNPKHHGQVLRVRRGVDVEHLAFIRGLRVRDVALRVLREGLLKCIVTDEL